MKSGALCVRRSPRRNAEVVIHPRNRYRGAQAPPTHRKCYPVIAQWFVGVFAKPARELLRLSPSVTLPGGFQMTRTLGAALGAVIVLLFFASLTFEQNRVVSFVRAAAISHR